MKFSVLMSLYIKEKPEYLDECLSSLHSQTLKANEVVIVFDGPLTRKLYDVVESWKSRLPIKQCELEKNVGLGEALQYGIQKCSYNLIARMDTDDVCQPDRFEKQIQYFQINPDIACVGSWISEFDSDPDNVIAIRKVPCSNLEIKKYSKLRNPMNHISVVYRKDAVLDSGGYKHLHFMEDYYLWLRMLAKGYEFMNIEECLVKARTGHGMLERRGGLEYVQSEFKISRIKHQLKVSKPLEAYSYMLLRAGSRIVSVDIRKKIYNYLRE